MEYFHGFVRSESDYVSSWYNEIDISLKDSKFSLDFTKDSSQKLKDEEYQISSRIPYYTRYWMSTMRFNL